MAKKLKAKIPQPVVITGEEKTVNIDVIGVKEAWSEYTLSDGTVLNIKPAVIQIRRIEGKYNPDGRPIYAIQAGVALDTIVPKKLLKKKGK